MYQSIKALWEMEEKEQLAEENRELKRKQKYRSLNIKN